MNNRKQNKILRRVEVLIKQLQDSSFFKKLKNKYSRFQDWHDEHVSVIRILTVISCVAIMGLLLLGTKFAPVPLQVNVTGVNKTLDYENESGSIKLLSKMYNPKENIMVLSIQTTRQLDAGSTVPIPQNQLKFKLQTYNPEKATMQIIPTTSDKFTLVVRHLTPKYRALKVKVINNTPTSTPYVDGDDSDTPAQKRAYKEAGKTVTLRVVTNKKMINSSIRDSGRKTFAIQTTKREIDHQQNLITSNKKKIIAAKKLISIDKNNIAAKKSDDQYNTTGEKKSTQDTLDNLQSDIASQNATIKTNQDAIKIHNQKIELLQQQIADVQSGVYKLPGEIQSTQNQNFAK